MTFTVARVVEVGVSSYEAWTYDEDAEIVACELLAKGVGEAFEACFARVVGCFALGSTGFRRCQSTITVAGTQGERKVVSDKSTPKLESLSAFLTHHLSEHVNR